MTWILTYSGKHLDLNTPHPDEIELEDIIIGLSREGRFANQTRNHYSVAQHSCLVADFILEHELEALLHDATEAYLRDIPSPLKRLLPEYSLIEARLDKIIRLKFGLPAQCTEAIHHADLIALATEQRDLMNPSRSEWGLTLEAHPATTISYVWSEREAYTKFKSRINVCLRRKALL